MIVVSNTSPLNYLILVGAVDVLPALYGEVYVPPTVVEELRHMGSPSAVRKWASSPPKWLEVRTPTHVEPSLELHAGEAEAIALAEEIGAQLILIDERHGREAARSHGVTPIGTLGVLYEAAGRGLVKLPEVVERLTAGTSFHWDHKLIDDLLLRDAARRRGPEGEK